MANYSDAEKFRHECEVRAILKMGDKNRMKSYMDLCEKHRGKAAADRLRTDVRAELIKQREAENGSGEKPRTRGATTAQQIYDQAGPSGAGAAGVQAGEAGKTQGRKRKTGGGNTGADGEGHVQAALF